MQIFSGRFLLRCVVFGVAIVTSMLVYRAWQIRQPNYYWQRAEKALAAGDQPRAELELRSCLARFPNHGRAHFQLAQVLVSRAQQQNPAADFATVPKALGHLKRAAELQPTRLEVQKTLLSAYARANRPREAEAVAIVVHGLDPADPQALLLVARRALAMRDLDAAGQKLAALSRGPLPQPFSAWFVTAEYGRLAKKPAERSAAIAAALQRAEALTPANVQTMPRDEQRALAALIVLGVENADTAAAAQRNVAQVLRLIESGPLAVVSSQLGLSLRSRFPLSTVSSESLAQRQQIEKQLIALAQQQVAAHSASPTVYHWLAEVAVAEGHDAAAISLLQEGIASTAAQGSSLPRLALHALVAARMLAAGRAEEAQPYLAPLLADEATRGDGYMLAGSVALACGRLDDARQAFEAAALNLGQTLPVRLALSTSYLALNRPADALPHLSVVVSRLDELNPQDKAWLARFVGDGLALRRALCESLLATDKIEEAQRQMVALAGTSEEPAALIALANWHWRRGEQARAEAALMAARGKYPEHLGLVLAQATIVCERGRPADADRLLTSFAAAQPRDLRRQLALIQWRVWRGQADIALAALPELKQRFGPLPLLGAIEAQLMLSTNRAGDALAAAKQLRDQPATRRAGVLIGAAAATQLGHTDAASSLLDELKSDGGPLADLIRAHGLSSSGHADQALDLLGTALRQTALAPQAGVEIGDALDKLAHRDGPQAALEKAGQMLKTSPDNPSLLAAHANLAIAVGKTDQALADLEHLEAVQPGTALVRYLRAQALANSGETSRALAELEKAISIEPANLDARQFAAELSLREGHAENARRHAQAILAADPHREAACVVAVAALKQLQLNAEAIGVLEQFIDRQPEHPGSYVRLAHLHQELGRPDRAQAVLQQAERRLPREFEPLAAEITLLVDTGQAPAAQALARRREAEHPDAFGAEQFGWLFLKLDQCNAARIWAEQFLATAGPQEAQAHWLLGNIAYQNGRRHEDPAQLAEAESQFRRVLESAPDHFGAANNLAYLLAHDLNRPQAALDVVRTLLARPELVNVTPEKLPLELVDTVATVLRKADRGDEALKLLTPAVRQHPDSAALQFQWGLSQLGAKNFEAAGVALETALRLGLSGAQAQEARRELDALRRQPQSS
ncbi:MAG: tetratricopeptide repeat protein [Planctomycetia bacterium]|nr:tetratricopeptide repeat protein [Planctomycetia bacterium]